MEPAVKYFFRTFGCRVNQYETESLRERLLKSGGEERLAYEDADVCVVNTCTVTAEADREALRLIGAIARRNPAARIIVTGCLATRDPDAVRGRAPAALVVGNEDKSGIPALLGCQAVPAWPGISGFSGHSRAFVKIQDGCNMSCSFCVIPSIRPRLSSKPPRELEEEVRGLVAGGFREVVLCGVRLGRYAGEDKGKRVDFCSVLERLLLIRDGFRIRLSSLEVTDVSERLLGLMESSGGKLCPSLHVPLQSGSDGVLKRMRRWYGTAFYRRRTEAFLSRVPKAALFADVMTGFPGETEAEHAESLRFIESAGFSGLHVFRYSRRPKTSADRLAQVPDAVIARRAGELRELDRRLRAAFAASRVGQRRTACVELAGRDALTEDFLSVELKAPSRPGLIPIRVVSADGPSALAELSTVSSRDESVDNAQTVP